MHLLVNSSVTRYRGEIPRLVVTYLIHWQHLYVATLFYYSRVRFANMNTLSLKHWFSLIYEDIPGNNPCFMSLYQSKFANKNKQIIQMALFFLCTCCNQSEKRRNLGNFLPMSVSSWLNQNPLTKWVSAKTEPVSFFTLCSTLNEDKNTVV